LRDARFTQRRADICAQNVTKVIKFQDAVGRMLERLLGHAFMMVSRSRVLRENDLGENALREKPASTPQKY